MISTIIDALNESTSNGIYVLHKGIKTLPIKSIEVVFYDLYFISSKDNSESRVLGLSRTRKREDSYEEFKSDFEKEFVKKLVLKIIKEGINE